MPLLRSCLQAVAAVSLAAAVLLAPAGVVWAELTVQPAKVVLEGPESTQQLLASGQLEGRVVDVSRRASYRVADPKVARVNASGLVTPRAEGRTEIVVSHEGTTRHVPLVVQGLVAPRPVSFQQEVIPVLTKATCNSGGCHGKAEGKNGFKLSVFGFDPAADFEALVKEGRGRRVSPARPEQSLLLKKGTAATPHGGGAKLEPDSLRYRRLLRWIREGARYTSELCEPVERIVVEPKQRVLLAGDAQQLQVTAIDAAGHRRCVTLEAEYESNAGTIADVSGRGLIEAGDVPGEAAIVVSYLGFVDVCRITLPRPGVKFARPAEFNFIDKHVWDKLARLGIPPSELADDATFLRRAFLDTIGTLPTRQEARQFLASTAADKRARLIDELLQRDEYADFWAMRWADLLRADQAAIDPEGTVAVTRWLRKQFASNRPYDQFVHDIVTAQGNIRREGPAAFFKVLGDSGAMSRSVSQLFLGVRIECAQCHHHPSEKWGQDDYTALAGFFTGVKRKKLPDGTEAIVSLGGSDLPHPRSGEEVPARALGAPPAEFAGVADRRAVLADWMTAGDNPFLAKALANRLWSHYFGRGLVEQIDDLRDTNPASNEPLLEALAAHLVEVDYDLKAFTRTLLNSRTYQLSSLANDANQDDQQNFSHAQYKALAAEVLADAICQATGVPDKYNGWPEGYRAIQVWDNRMPSYFFRIFGRPVRASVCECERSNEPSIAQALHLMNSPEITGKIQHRRGTARQLADAPLDDRTVIEELYLATLSRLPSAEEMELCLQAFEPDGSGRRAAAEDILWALLNSKDFIFNH